MTADSITFPLRNIVDFLTWQHRFREVPGYLHDLEGHALMLLAGGGGGVGAIVEIGSFLGRSTVYLAAGSKSAGREKVVAVDHFRGSPEHQPGQTHASDVLIQEGTTFNRFQANLQRQGLEDYMVPIIASSVEAGERWDTPIRLLFIDGDHSYDASKKDFEVWSPFVVPHGLIGFHDIGAWPGVTQFYEELLQNNNAFREALSVNSLRVIQRLP
jgi:predicted O-methyltransferase YrrM